MRGSRHTSVLPECPLRDGQYLRGRNRSGNRKCAIRLSRCALSSAGDVDLDIGVRICISKEKKSSFIRQRLLTGQNGAEMTHLLISRLGGIVGSLAASAAGVGTEALACSENDDLLNDLVIILGDAPGVTTSSSSTDSFDKLELGESSGSKALFVLAGDAHEADGSPSK